MSFVGILKALSSAAAVAEPHLTKLIDFKRALAISEAENERLAEENKSLKTQLLVTAVLSVLFFVAFIITLVLLLTK